MRPVQTLILEALSQIDPAPKSLLDIGCGDGAFTLALHAAFPETAITALDLRFPKYLAGQRRIDFVTGSAESLPFAPTSFDVLTASLSLHHWDNKARGISEAFRVLKDGGQLIMGDPLLEDWLSNRFLGWAAQKTDGGNFAAAKELLGYFEVAGFVSVSINVVPRSLKSLYIIVAKKPTNPADATTEKQQVLPWEKTLEELWQRFPIQLEEHNPQWGQQYVQEAKRLTALLGNAIAQIDHIGSTAVEGLVAKPIVDILLQTEKAAQIETIKEALMGDGWMLMAENPKRAELDFNKGYSPAGFADEVFHLHVKPLGDWDELYFRDYLRTHPDVAAQYAALKCRLRDEFEHDRDAYTAAKGDFIATYSAIVRQEK